jgi:NAD/NADP transhydrogenase beta subunit
MARSHHRKKHKEHLRQFKNKGETVSHTPKSKASGIFAVGGAIIGLAVSYFGSQGSLLWIVIGLIAGGAAGYFVGRRLDADKE